MNALDNTIKTVSILLAEGLIKNERIESGLDEIIENIQSVVAKSPFYGCFIAVKNKMEYVLISTENISFLVRSKRNKFFENSKGYGFHHPVLTQRIKSVSDINDPVYLESLIHFMKNKDLIISFV